MKIQAPLKVHIVVGVTNGEQQAEVTYQMPAGQLSNPQALREAMTEVLTNPALKGFRLMTKREYWDFICDEQFGARFALEGGEQFDA